MTKVTAKRDLESSWEGTVYTHRVLMQTAQRFLATARDETNGSYQNTLGAAMFAWLAFEAYLNFVIEHLDPAVFKRKHQFFSRKESGYAGVLGKLRWVLDRLNVTPPRGAERRRRTLLRLHRLRNQMAHAKPVRYAGRLRHPSTEDAPFMESKWVESQATIANVRRYVAAVDEFSEWLHAAIKPKFRDPHMRGSAFRGTAQAQSFRTTSALKRQD